MLKWLLVLSVLFFVTSCGRTLSEEAVNQAKIAIEFEDYEHATLLLVMGCRDLHAQSIYLLRMVEYRATNDLFGMVESWVGIYNIDASEYFIQEEAYHVLRTTLDSTSVLNSR